MVDVPDKNAPFRAAIDSTIMLFAARFIMPSLLTAAVAIIGWFGTTMLSDLKAGQQQQWMQMGKMADAQAQTNNVQSGLSVKVDSAVKQLDHLQAQVDSLPKH
jgi:hypothetical protein